MHVPIPIVRKALVISTAPYVDQTVIQLQETEITFLLFYHKTRLLGKISHAKIHFLLERLTWFDPLEHPR